MKALQLVRALPVQSEGMVELLKDRFHDLAYPGQPAAQSLGPGGLAVAFGRGDQPAAVTVLPPLMPLPSLEALVRHIPAQALRQAQEAPPEWAIWGGEYAGRRKNPRPVSVLGAGLGKAEAGDDALGIDRKQQVKAFIPAQAVAPANVSLSGQPPELVEGRRPGVSRPLWEPRNCPTLRRGSAVPATARPGSGRKPPGFRSSAGSAG